MNPFFAYLIKSSISLTILYCLFRFTMRNDRTHSLNRFLLLGILTVSAIIPFLDIQFFYEEIPIKQVDVFREFVAPPVFAERIASETVQPIIESGSSSINPWLAFYLLVISALVIRLVLGVIKVMQIISRAEKRRLQKIVLAVVKDLIQPFTFINKVVLSEKDFTENKNIIVAHEHAHIKQLHTIDLMVCEVFTVMHFFNPFMWLLRRDLKLIHEYQADQAVLNKGIDAKTYQLLVLQKSVGERRFAMANHFTQKPILKRIKMMQKKNGKQWKGVKLILFIPIILLLLQAFARSETLVEKASEFVPVIIQKDSSDVWLESWTASTLKSRSTFKRELSEGSKGSGKFVAVMAFRNTLGFSINKEDKLSIGKSMEVEKEDVHDLVYQFYKGNHPNYKLGPEYVTRQLHFVGDVHISRGEVYLFHDKDASKELIEFTVKNIGKAYLGLRKEKSLEKFNKEYFSLNNEERQIIDEIVPIHFSISTPPPPKVIEILEINNGNASNSHKPPPPPPPKVIQIEDNDKTQSVKTVKPPPPPPPPVNITIKNNGDIYVGKHKYDSFEAFHEKLVEWDNQLTGLNEKNSTRYFYQANLTVEPDVPESLYKKVNLACYRKNIHVDKISRTTKFGR